MKGVAHNNADKSFQERTIEDLFHTVFMDIYLEKNANVSEGEKLEIENAIRTFVSDSKRYLKQALLPLEAKVKLAEKQVVLCEDLSEDTLNAIVNADNIDALINTSKEFQSKINEIIEILGEERLMSPYKGLYLQAIGAYENGAYDLSVLGFLAIIDGLLSDIAKDQIEVGITKRVKEIVDIEDFHFDQDDVSINEGIKRVAILKASKALGRHIPFNRHEPNALNRHWVMHGRSRTKKTKSDCNRLILFLHGLISVAEI